jgi:hypothetical protein
MNSLQAFYYAEEAALDLDNTQSDHYTSLVFSVAEIVALSKGDPDLDDDVCDVRMLYALADLFTSLMRVLQERDIDLNDLCTLSLHQLRNHSAGRVWEKTIE